MIILSFTFCVNKACTLLTLIKKTPKFSYAKENRNSEYNSQSTELHVIETTSDVRILILWFFTTDLVLMRMIDSHDLFPRESRWQKRLSKTRFVEKVMTHFASLYVHNKYFSSGRFSFERLFWTSFFCVKRACPLLSLLKNTNFSQTKDKNVISLISKFSGSGT